MSGVCGALGGRVSLAMCSSLVPSWALTPFPFVWSGRRYLFVSISSGSEAGISGSRSGFAATMGRSGGGSSCSALWCDLSDLRLDNEGMRTIAPFQGRPRRSIAVCDELARCSWSIRLSCSSGRRPTGSR